MQLPLDTQKQKGIQLQGGGFASLTPHRGLCPLDPAGGSAPRPPLSSRSALAIEFELCAVL